MPVIVLSCCAGKREDRPLIVPGIGKMQIVAKPDGAICNQAHPDQKLAGNGMSCRDLIEQHNSSDTKKGTSFLYQASDLYKPHQPFHSIYRDLAEEHTHFYILSAGWGIVRSSYLIPNYDITFSSQAKNRHPERYRKWGHGWRGVASIQDFNHLGDDVQSGRIDANDEIHFFGGADYQNAMKHFTGHLKNPKILWFLGNGHSKVSRDGQGFELRPFLAPRRMPRTWLYFAVDEIFGNPQHVENEPVHITRATTFAQPEVTPAQKFQCCIMDQLRQAHANGNDAITIVAGELQRRTQIRGRQPSCCGAMRNLMREEYDDVDHGPPGAHASVRVTFNNLSRRISQALNDPKPNILKLGRPSIEAQGTKQAEIPNPQVAQLTSLGKPRAEIRNMKQPYQNPDRLKDLIRFYDLIGILRERLGGEKLLSQCNGRMNWPEKGVYFFFENNEIRNESGTGPRVVRVGTHGLTKDGKSTLWKRLHQHRGGTHNKGGNHRGSIFRLIVGSSLRSRSGNDEPKSWGVGSGLSSAAVKLNLSRETTEHDESELERSVSAAIGSMPFLWLRIEDAYGPASLRGRIERNSITLLSNYNKTPLDPASATWLGRHCDRLLVQQSGLWNNNHVNETYDPLFLDDLEDLIVGL